MRDERARRYVVEATKGAASLVRSTLGPRGMEKLIQTVDPHGESELVLTADGGEILAAIERGEGFNHPVAALFVDCVDSMQRGLDDGTTTAMVLTGELVGRGSDLVDEGLHPGTVAVGYALASARAGRVLDSLARPVTGDDRATLERIAATSMTAAVADDAREAYAAAVADAVERLADGADRERLDTDDLKVLAANDADAGLYDGLVVRRRPGAADEAEVTNREFDWTPDVPRPLDDAGVALVDGEVAFEDSASAPDGGTGGLSVAGPEAIADYRTDRRERIDAIARQLRDVNADVVVSQPAVDDVVRRRFERAGLRVVDDVKYPLSDVYRLARATGGEVVSRVDEVTADAVGTAGRVSERRVGDEKWTVFDECDGGVSTLVVDARTSRGASARERLVENALDATAMAVSDGQALPGGGAPAMAVATDLREYARSVSAREQLAVEAFADAVETLVYVLAENAGLDPIDSLAALRRAHASAGESPAPCGLDCATGEAVDAWDAGVREPRRVFSQAVETATATTEQLLTIDAVLYPNVDEAAFRPQTEYE